MKAIISWRKHHHMARVGIFLIVVALVVSMIGCESDNPEEEDKYTLTINSTTGGSVTTPGEGTRTYDSEEEVDLVATPAADYDFDKWTGDVSTIDDVEAATTTITMSGNYTITANFVATVYILTISSTAGGSVTEPGEAGPYSYAEGAVVNLTAVAEGGYNFVSWTGDVDTIADVEDATTNITMDGTYTIIANFEAYFMIAAGYYHTVGLGCNGTVFAVGRDDENQCDVGDWTDIVQIAAGAYHTVGLKDDGTVVAVGDNDNEQCDVDSWTDIVQVAAGALHTVGVKEDGSVVAAGLNDDDQCDVDSWRDIVQVAAGGWHTVGVKDDGSVVAVGLNDDGQCDVSGWNDIVQLAAGGWHTVGLEDDGTVVAVGWEDDEQCDVGDWEDIIQVAAGNWHTVGVEEDNTVVAVGDNYNEQCDVGGWTDIIQVSAGRYHTVGLKSSGTVVATGSNYYEQCNISSWMLKGSWNLTVSSTDGGSVTEPGEAGPYIYEEGTVVPLVAVPAEHYRFVEWTGDVANIGNAEVATTNITMEDNYAITATFEQYDPMVVAGIEIELAKWNLIEETP